jgi:hypothetical protein
MSSQVSLFVTLLVTAITSGGPSAGWDIQKIMALWSQAGAQIASAPANPTPSPSASPFVLAFAPDIDDDKDDPTPNQTQPPLVVPAEPSPVAYTPTIASTPTPWAMPAEPSPVATSSSSAVSAPVPYPPPYVLPSGAAQSIASGNYVRAVTTSQAFPGNTPFHHTVAELKAAGATILPHAVAENWWARGRQNEKPYNATPVYVGLTGQATHRVSCSGYGFACDATGLQLHLPAGFTTQLGNTDHHIAVIDLELGKEIDLFLCQPGSADCVNGGAYPLSGTKATGLVIDTADPNSSGNAGGYAFGIFQLTATDINNAIATGQPIPHALGTLVDCVGNAPVWPSRHNADALCHGWPNVPNVVYGDVLALKPEYQVPPAASAPCKAILLTLKTMGSYVADVSPGYGSDLHAENPIVYGSGPNPWDDLARQMVAAGEGSGSGTSFGFSCESKWTTANDWDVLQLNQAGDGALPPLSVAAVQPQ